MRTNDDFLFAQEALRQGYVTDVQVDEGFLLQKRMADDLKLDERLGVILVKRGYIAEDQARRVYARIQPDKGQGEIRGYRLVDVIGRGAMGTVYKAIHLGLNREVALKILRPDLAGDRTQVERLKAEAAMLGSLDHPNVVRALDAGEANGFPYVVMEYVEGETLRDRLRREGPLKEDEALRITRGLADALERARRMGIVHRDVKPGNVLLTRNGTPKLMDLGLAKGPIDLGLTQHGATVGTPQYIAPEQAVDPRKADTRSDIYGLGATLYAMLVGRPPFDGQTLAEIITKVLYEVPVPVRTLRPEVSAEAGYLVERMMLKDPGLRYRTPLAVVQDIDRLMQGTSILPTGFSGNWEAWLLRKKQRRWITVYLPAAAAAILVAFGANWGVQRVRRGDSVSALEDRIQTVLLATVPQREDNLQSLRDKLERARAPAPEARELDPGNREDLEARIAKLEEEERRWAEFQALLHDTVRPLEGSGRRAEADAALEAFIRASHGDSPAAREAEAERTQLRARSDQALARARDERFSKAPADLEDARRSLVYWRDMIRPKFAWTEYAQKAQEKASDAVSSATAVVQSAKEGLDDLSGERLAKLAAQRDFTGLALRLSQRRTRAEGELDQAVANLAPFYSATALREILAAAFDAVDRSAKELVEAAWNETAARADELDGERRWEEAAALLAAFDAAARDAYAEFADAARAKRDLLVERTEREMAQAVSLWKDLLRGALETDFPAGDTASVRRRVEEALSDSRFWPVVGRLQGLARAADVHDAFTARAMEGIVAHLGTEKDRWIDRVLLKDGASERVERQWEVVAVDRAARAFTIVSHKGNQKGLPETHGLRELTDAQVEQFAALDPDAPDHQAMLAVFRLSVLPFGEKDPHARLDAWKGVAGLLAAPGAALAGPDGDGPAKTSPLAAHAHEAVARLEEETKRVESLAKKHWEAAQETYAAKLYSEALSHLKRLQGEELRFSLLSKARAKEVSDQIDEIVEKLTLDKLALILVGSRVERSKRASEGLFATVTFDFNTVEQGGTENFPRGLARFVNTPAGGGRVTTPGGSGEELALMLNPGRETELLRDRPLVLALPLDPRDEMSVGFDLWVARPFFLGIDLEGAHVGVLSADPIHERFASGVPRLEREKKPPEHDFYARGRGVAFHAGEGFEDPGAWLWDDGHQGRHFVDKDRASKARKEEMARRWFAFEARPNPYRVRFVRKGATLRLEVDGSTVYEESHPEWKALLASTGEIRILSWTTCVIDQLQVTGRIDQAWFDRTLKERGIDR